MNSLDKLYHDSFSKLFTRLSNKTLSIRGTLDHLVHRMNDRSIQFEDAVKAINQVINGKQFCQRDIFESVLSGGSKAFSCHSNGIKVMYSVYVNGYEITVVIRSLAKTN